MSGAPRVGAPACCGCSSEWGRASLDGSGGALDSVVRGFVSVGPHHSCSHVSRNAWSASLSSHPADDCVACRAGRAHPRCMLLGVSRLAGPLRAFRWRSYVRALSGHPPETIKPRASPQVVSASSSTHDAHCHPALWLCQLAARAAPRGRPAGSTPGWPRVCPLHCSPPRPIAE